MASWLKGRRAAIGEWLRLRATVVRAEGDDGVWIVTMLGGGDRTSRPQMSLELAADRLDRALLEAPDDDVEGEGVQKVLPEKSESRS